MKKDEKDAALDPNNINQSNAAIVMGGIFGALALLAIVCIIIAVVIKKRNVSFIFVGGSSKEDIP